MKIDMPVTAKSTLNVIRFRGWGFIMNRALTVSFFLSFSFVAACSAPDVKIPKLSDEAVKAERQLQLEQSITYQRSQTIRLAETAHPLLKLAPIACENKTRYRLGVLLHSLEQYSDHQKPAAKSLYQFDNAVQVNHVLTQGPAVGHLQHGDKLVAINGSLLSGAHTTQLKIIKDALRSGTPVKLQFWRHEEQQQTTITPEQVCDYPVLLRNSDMVNAYADGSNIIITSGLMRYAEKDSELAMIIAHEMAHNSQQHIWKRLKNTALGSLIDIALITQGIVSPFINAGIGGNLYSQHYELEADIVAVRMLYKSGFSLEGIDQFWRKIAAIHPRSITHGKLVSHPTTVERVLVIQKEISQLTTP